MGSGDIANGVATIVQTAKTGLSLFTEWPLNLIVYAGLLGIGISLVARFIPKRKK